MTQGGLTGNNPLEIYNQEVHMRTALRFLAMAMAAVLLAAPSASAMGIELALGGWRQEPQGTVAMSAISQSDVLDVENDMRYDEETRIYGRAKIDMPAFVPNIYLMATPMSFDGTGQKNVDFKFGDRTFQAGVDFYSKVDLDHFDIALYYGLPFVETATAGVLNLELGLNVRVVDFEAVVEGTESATGSTVSETESFVLPLPMLYVGAQLRPTGWLALEAEGRGVAYNGDHVMSFIGRAKVKPLGPLFIAAGWRHEDIDVEEDEVTVDVEISGPFAEVGLEF